MNTQKNQKKKQKKIILGIVITLVALLVIFLIQQNTDNATISIAPTGERANVYINRSSVSPSLSTSSKSTYEVSSSSHQVLIAYDGYWPWSQQVSAAGGETVDIQPFLIEQSGRQVLQTTSDIREALVNARTEPIPDIDSPIISENENVRVYIDGETNIIAQWNKSTSTAPDFFNCYEGTCGVSVFDRLPIQQIAFYPERDDVIFFATPNGVFAMDIDPSGETQNFQPVVESVRDPSFTISDGNIFISYGDRIMVSDI